MNTTVVDNVKRLVTVRKNQLVEILPHKGRALFLDEVVIDNKAAVGVLRVTFELCEGHEVFNGQKIMRGVDILEMAAQLLGVWCYLKKQEIGLGSIRMAVVRRYGETIFRRPVFPGQVIVVQLLVDNILVNKIYNSGRVMVEGRDIKAYAEDKIVALIDSIELFISR